MRIASSFILHAGGFRGVSAGCLSQWSLLYTVTGRLYSFLHLVFGKRKGDLVWVNRQNNTHLRLATLQANVIVEVRPAQYLDLCSAVPSTEDTRRKGRYATAGKATEVLIVSRHVYAMEHHGAYRLNQNPKPSMLRP